LDSVENVARAFYEAQDDACSWDGERPLVKNMFIVFARQAIDYLEKNPRIPMSPEAAIADMSKDSWRSHDTFAPTELVH